MCRFLSALGALEMETPEHRASLLDIRSDAGDEDGVEAHAARTDRAKKHKIRAEIRDTIRNLGPTLLFHFRAAVDTGMLTTRMVFFIQIVQIIDDLE